MKTLFYFILIVIAFMIFMIVHFYKLHLEYQKGGEELEATIIKKVYYPGIRGKYNDEYYFELSSSPSYSDSLVVKETSISKDIYHQMKKGEKIMVYDHPNWGKLIPNKLTGQNPGKLKTVKIIAVVIIVLTGVVIFLYRKIWT